MHDAPAPDSPWSSLIPNCLFLAFFLAECLLWLSERFLWFDFSAHQGWTVLLALATAAVALLLTVASFLVCLVFGWRFPFSIRSLGILILAVAIPCGWLSAEIRKAKRQREAVEEIAVHSGQVLYDYQLDDAGNAVQRIEPPGRPSWLPGRRGNDFFRSVAAVRLWNADVSELKRLAEMSQLRKLNLGGTQVTDGGMEYLKGLTQLRWLALNGTQITDAGLECLEGMKQLEELDLGGARITDAGLARLAGLTQLQRLDLARTKITGKGLSHLYGLSQLRSLELGDTSVTGQSAAQLRQALPGCNTGGAEVHNDRGLAMLRSRQFDEALAEFNEALLFDPDYASAYVNRGNARLGKKEYDAAIGDYTKGLDLAPENTAAYLNRGNLWHARKENAKALADYDRAVKLDPNFFVAYSNRGLVWYDLKEFDKALADFGRALAANPAYAPAYINRSSLWNDKREFDKALADSDRAIALNPNATAAYLNRGNAHFYKGEYDKAVADFSQIIRLNPASAGAYRNRGDVLAAKRDFDRAIADFSQAIKYGPAAMAYSDRGICWAERGKYDKALADFNEATKLDASSANAFANLAWIQASCPDPRYRDGKAAVANAAPCLSIERRKAREFFATLAEACAENGDYGNACQWQIKAIDLAPNEKSKSDGRARLELYKQGKPYRMEPKSP